MKRFVKHWKTRIKQLLGLFGKSDVRMPGGLPSRDLLITPRQTMIQAPKKRLPTQ